MLTNLEVAKSKLAIYCPEFVSLLCKLELVQAHDLPTAATNGRQLFYNPPWLDSLTISEIAGVLIHEIAHNMQGHPARMLIGNREPDRANWAMDVILNQMLLEYFEEIKTKSSGAFAPTLPDIAIMGPRYDKYKGWNWERVYEDDKRNNSKPRKTMDTVQGGVNPDGTAQNASQAEALAAEWKMAAQQAATIARGRGMQSSFFESFIHGLTATKVDWRAEVRDIATKAAKEDQSFRRFNRKFINRRIYLPGWYSEKLGNILVATDTSGSMDDGSFKYALGAMNEIMMDLKPEKVFHMCCDTQVHSVEELTQDDLPIVAKPFKGRGGTILTPIFEWVKKQQEDIDFIAVLTDGGHEVVDKMLEPSCPVVWLICSGDDGAAAKASFGRVIKV